MKPLTVFEKQGRSSFRTWQYVCLLGKLSPMASVQTHSREHLIFSDSGKPSEVSQAGDGFSSAVTNCSQFAMFEGQDVAHKVTYTMFTTVT